MKSVNLINFPHCYAAVRHQLSEKLFYGWVAFLLNWQKPFSRENELFFGGCMQLENFHPKQKEKLLLKLFIEQQINRKEHNHKLSPTKYSSIVHKH